MLWIWRKIQWVAAAIGAVLAALLLGFVYGRGSAQRIRRQALNDARRKYLEHAARKQQEYAETPEPAEKELLDKLRHGGFVFVLFMALPLAACAHTPPVTQDAALVCPVPTPLAAPIQREAARQLKICGDNCWAVKRVLAAAARDRENMRKCRGNERADGNYRAK